VAVGSLLLLGLLAFCFLCCRKRRRARKDLEFTSVGPYNNLPHGTTSGLIISHPMAQSSSPIVSQPMRPSFGLADASPASTSSEWSNPSFGTGACDHEDTQKTLTLRRRFRSSRSPWCSRSGRRRCNRTLLRIKWLHLLQVRQGRLGLPMRQHDLPRLRLGQVDRLVLDGRRRAGCGCGCGLVAVAQDAVHRTTRLWEVREQGRGVRLLVSLLCSSLEGAKVISACPPVPSAASERRRALGPRTRQASRPGRKASRRTSA
jgi:hypothetical protein